MYFILSKVLLFILYPLCWTVVLILISLFSKRPKLKRQTLRVAAALLIIFSNRCVLYIFAKCWDVSPGQLQKDKVYSVAIVLGGFSSEDKNGKGHFNGSADRFIQGVKLKTVGRVSHIMITSGNGSLVHDGFSEGTWAKGELKRLKFADSAILIEDKSRNTIENAAFSKVILDKSHLPGPYLLVTSAFHMRRSLYIFKKTGIPVIPYPCDYMIDNSKLSLTDYFIPDANTLNTWSFYLKEIVGLVITYIKFGF